MKNNHFTKKLLYLLSVMAVIAVVGSIICVISYKNHPKSTGESGKLKVVTSFHPVYILTKNLLRYNDADVSNMTPNLSGCLHDYQVTTEDMRKLSKADIFVVNGMGMESFTESLAARYPGLPIFVASNDEAFEDEDHDHNHDHDQDHDHNHDHAHEENGHLWMNPHSYLDEFNNLHNDFTDYYLENGSEGDLNALYLAYEEYGRKILSLMAEYDSLAKKVSGDTYVISFNEAFEIFAEGLNMNILAAFSLDEDEMPSAGEIAKAIKEAKAHDRVLVLIERDLAFHAEKIVKETGAQVIFTDPLTGGDDSYDSYLYGMKANIEAVAEVLDK